MKIIHVILAASFLLGSDLAVAQVGSPCVTGIVDHLLSAKKAEADDAAWMAHKTCRYFGGPSFFRRDCKFLLEKCMQTVVRKAGVNVAAENLKHYEERCSDSIASDSWFYDTENAEECEETLKRELERLS